MKYSDRNQSDITGNDFFQIQARGNLRGGGAESRGYRNEGSRIISKGFKGKDIPSTKHKNRL